MRRWPPNSLAPTAVLSGRSFGAKADGTIRRQKLCDQPALPLPSCKVSDRVTCHEKETAGIMLPWHDGSLFLPIVGTGTDLEANRCAG